MAKAFEVSNKRLAMAAGIALVVNAIIYFIGSASSATWDVGFPYKLGLPMLAGASAFPILIGGLIVRLISKKLRWITSFASWAVLIFAIAGSPGGYVSSNDLPTGLSLGAMHVVVGLAWFIALRKPKDAASKKRGNQQYLVVNTFHEGIGMKDILKVVVLERVKVKELQKQGMLGEVKLAVPQGKVFIDVFADTTDEAKATVEQLPMSKWWDIEVYSLSGKV